MANAHNCYESSWKVQNTSIVSDHLTVFISKHYVTAGTPVWTWFSGFHALLCGLVWHTHCSMHHCTAGRPSVVTYAWPSYRMLPSRCIEPCMPPFLRSPVRHCLRLCEQFRENLVCSISVRHAALCGTHTQLLSHSLDVVVCVLCFYRVLRSKSV